MFVFIYLMVISTMIKLSPKENKVHRVQNIKQCYITSLLIHQKNKAEDSQVCCFSNVHRCGQMEFLGKERDLHQQDQQLMEINKQA